METIGLIFGLLIALLGAGAINVIRKVLVLRKQEKELKKVKEKAEKDKVITKAEQSEIDKEIEDVKQARKDLFKSILSLLSAMIQMKINKNAKASDLIDELNNKIK